MSTHTASMDRDANRHVIGTNEAFKTTKQVTFAGGSGTGAVGTINLFTVTGDVLVLVFATCSADLTSAGVATIEVGISGNTSGLIAQSTATTIDVGESWTDATPTTVEALPTSPRILTNGADVIATVGTAAIDTGALTFYALWRPLSTDGNLVAA